MVWLIQSCRLFSFLLIAASLTAAPSLASSRPACGSDAADAFIDAQTDAGNRASESGRHREAFRIWAELAAYHQRCIEPAVVAYNRGAGNAVVNVSDQVRQNGYARAIDAFTSAAREARILGDSKKRCLFARSAQDDERIAYPGDKPDAELLRLLAGCR